MPLRLREALVRYLPKACLDFRALINEPTSLSDVRRLSCPCLILRGEDAPRGTRLIAEALAARLPRATRLVIAGAGHMGPLTHAGTVADLIAEFINANECASSETAALAA